MRDLIKDFLLPVKISDLQGNWKNTNTLLKKKLIQIGTNETDVAEIHGKGYILLDFGKEYCGGIRILTSKAENTDIRIRFGESYGEAMSELCEKGSCNNHSLRDFNCTLVDLSDMQFGQTGFRFVRIDFLNDTNICTLKNIYAAYSHRDLNMIGKFKCSDETINKIFDTAAYTLTLNMQEFLWDGIKRDRLVWVGDMHPEMMTITSLFGEDFTVEESLTFAKNQAEPPEWMNGIAMYSMWWIIILHDYYLQNRNSLYVMAQLDYLENLLEEIDKRIDENGNGDFDWQFLDWPTNNTPDARTGVNALFIIAIRDAKNLLEEFRRDYSICEALLKKLLRFRSEKSSKKQVIALRILADLETVESSSLLTQNGAAGMSTFMSYYILSAVAKSGKYSRALEMMKQYYGAMLDKGATTFWEDFDLSWVNDSGRIDEKTPEGKKDIHGDFGAFCYTGFRHSLCHGWSSGPVPYLMHHVIGIKVTKPGCRQVTISPNIDGLDFAKGTYPTPYGEITVECTRKDDGSVDIEVTAPNEIEIIKG